MALMHIDFFSDVLGMSMNMDVIWPQQTKKQIGMKGAAGNGQYKTMYLLHGMSDDHTTWQRRTSIERYASGLGIAVVMPSTHLGFYTDTTYGMRYWTFLSEELPAVCREFFPRMSDRREDTLAAGLSMGGYGAWKLGLRASGTFGAAASLSGALDIVDDYKRNAKEPGEDKTQLFKGIFGSPAQLEGSDDDILALAEKLAAKNAGFSAEVNTFTSKDGRLPRLYAWCGTEDFLYEGNLKVWERVKKLGYDLTCMASSGNHQWKYWDSQIKDVLCWWLGADLEFE